MPRPSSVLDGGRFGDEAFRVQNLLQYIPRLRITQPNADSDCRIQTGQSRLLQVAETLWRLIRDTDRCMNTNSPGTGVKRRARANHCSHRKTTPAFLSAEAGTDV